MRSDGSSPGDDRRTRLHRGDGPQPGPDVRRHVRRVAARRAAPAPGQRTGCAPRSAAARRPAASSSPRSTARRPRIESPVPCPSDGRRRARNWRLDQPRQPALDQRAPDPGHAGSRSPKNDRAHDANHGPPCSRRTPRDAARPGRTARCRRAVLIAVVLDDRPATVGRPGQPRPMKPPARIEDVDVDLGLGQPAVNDRQPQQRLRPGFRARPDQLDSAVNAARSCPDRGTARPAP